VQKRVAALVNQPGAAEILIDVLQNGNAFETQQAAFGLGMARSDLIRRRLRQLARDSEGDRRLACLAALTPEELAGFLTHEGAGARSTLLESSSLIALNRPGEFVDLVCEGAAVVDMGAVDEIEQMRVRYGIGAMSMYAPLLRRPLTETASARVAAILGSVSGQDVAGLLKKLGPKAKSESLQRDVRREQLRQASLALNGARAPQRTGVAILRPLKQDGNAWMEIFEALPGPWTIQTSVCWSARTPPDFMSLQLEGPPDLHVEGTLDQRTDAPLTLGQAKTVLEAFSEAQRESIAPVIDRLSEVPAEELPATAIGSLLSEGDAAELLRSPLWSAWRPFEGLAGADPQTLVASLNEKRSGPAQLAAGLQHMSIVMQLRNEDKAAGVAAEALWVAKKRPSALALALAAAELAKRSA
jgi:hypothetical protein